MPTVSMYALPARAGNERISPAPTATAASRSVGPSQRGASEPRRKSTSEESMRAKCQGGEQRDVEHGLRPGGAEWNLEQAHQHAEHHRGDRSPRHAAKPTDHDDRH